MQQPRESAHTTAGKVAHTVAVPEEAGRRSWAPRRYDTHHRGITGSSQGEAKSHNEATGVF
ncbi:hypothetical protein [Streptomyces sp. NPDC050388]|uniref:hypothetical protein n=1 Tax=Streptomyces sp. NPDC050388 TaxID=3155781 RepID=UPI003439CFF6